MIFCNPSIQQPSVSTNFTNFTNNNTYFNNFYNRQTNINQTFINNDNASLSINNNITVNNYNQFGKRTGLNCIRPGFNQRIGNFLCGYRQPVQTGCGCKTQIPQLGFRQTFNKYCYQPVQRFCSGIANTLRGLKG